MYISIGVEVGWGTSGGVFDCIVEGTRSELLELDAQCVGEIYRPLDEQGKSFIVLNYVGEECFNLFYYCCEKAMAGFSQSERGRIVPESHIPGILWNWSEVLRLMQTDPRYKAKFLERD